jgi:NAD(P)-dependent dehydrogenase (short-subunit alcohol dehydrogenase family)
MFAARSLLVNSKHRGVALAVALGAGYCTMGSNSGAICAPAKDNMFTRNDYYTIPNQPQRFANAKKEKNERYLNIDSVYDPSFVKGKTVVVTGGNRGLGLAIAKELIAQGARVIVTTRSPMCKKCLPGVHKVITGVDVTDDACGTALVAGLTGEKVDILVNNAGYFYGPKETLGDLNMKEELKMIDICALGPLRVTAAIKNAGLFSKKDCKIIMITSQGGSVSWRTTQNPGGGDYGHHMSKSAANMMGMLVAQEVRSDGIQVGILHPGFNKTEMTSKYAHIWEVEGAVDSSVGAKRTVHEIGQLEGKIRDFNASPACAGPSVNCLFVNCEDGKLIPW